MQPFNLLQITDCHLGSQPNEELLGLNTDESLGDVLSQSKSALPNPDLILCTGDISNDGGAQSYERFIAFVRQYYPDQPLAWLPGNHDDPTNMDLVSEIPIEAHYRAGGWNLIFLDSRIPMEEGGDLSASELERLNSELEKHKDLPTMVFLHHQPVPVGSTWVDQYTVKSKASFFEVIDRYPNVKAISWGHVHQEFNELRNGVALMATPSTCVQFVPKQDEFQVHNIMPGYRHYQLFPDGHFTTKVHRVSERRYGIDFAATGY